MKTQLYRGFRIEKDRKYYHIIRTDIETDGWVATHETLKGAKHFVDLWHDEGYVFKAAFVNHAKT